MLINSNDKKEIAITFGEHNLLLTAYQSIYWPSKKILIIADLHLEKGSYFAKKGNPLPLYDSFDTLKRLQNLCEIYKPETILSLGDNIHDSLALERMNQACYELLRIISAPLKQWFWIMGNHDTAKSPSNLTEQFYFCNDYQIENLHFTHNFLANSNFQIAGHYHPKITVKKMTGKCFVKENKRLILPAFGTFTGGLDIDSQAFKSLHFSKNSHVFMLYREKIWQVR